MPRHILFSAVGVIGVVAGSAVGVAFAADCGGTNCSGASCWQKTVVSGGVTTVTCNKLTNPGACIWDYYQANDGNLICDTLQQGTTSVQEVQACADGPCTPPGAGGFTITALCAGDVVRTYNTVCCQKCKSRGT
jgi:hypothetical protein